MTESRVQLASIFRRGGHKQELLGNEALPEQQELSQQLQQLTVAWALPKAKKGLGAAVWRPLLGAFEVMKRGSHQFNGQGFMRNKKLYLNIEEAVFLLDQCALLLLLEHDGGQQQLLSMQEAMHMMVQLGVSQDRSQVLSHLCRLGFHVKRHPACWLVQQEEHPAAAAAAAAAWWQQNKAWRNTDGLPLLLLDTEETVDDQQQQHQHQHQQQDSNSLQSLQQQGQQQQECMQGPAPAAAAAAADHRLLRKKRRVDAPVAAGAAAAATAMNVDMQQEVFASGSWWEATPCWLQAAQAPQQQQQQHDAQAAEAHQHNTQHNMGSTNGQQQQQQQQLHAVPMLLGEQLLQQFPNLRPLPAYQPHQLQQHGNAPDLVTCDLVYDVLPVDPNFSHYNPPPPHLSIAMPKPGCLNMPPLDELLQLAAAAAAAPPAAAGGVQPESHKSVMFGMPDGSDVNFYELRQVQLMNMLTNTQ